MSSDDLFAEMLPHQTGRRELGGVVGVKHLLEATLVVIVSVVGSIVGGADVDYDEPLSMVAASRVRVSGAEAKRGSLRRRLTASASSAWKVPLWVIMCSDMMGRPTREWKMLC